MEEDFYGRNDRIRYYILKTPRLYLVAPDGERYNNVKQIEGKDIIVNSTMDETDFKHTNRVGIIIGCPKRGGVLKEGDKVIVHHNSFRKWFNVRGMLKDSANFIKEGTFALGLDQIFAYDRGDGWVALEDYCFIKPIDKITDFLFDTDKYQSKEGTVKINNPILEKQGIAVGDKVFFVGAAEYRFEIEDETLWKMSAFRNVKLAI